MKKAKITIVLDYDLEELSAMLGREVKEEDFEEEVLEYAFHDLQELIRTAPLNVWSRLETSNG